MAIVLSGTTNDITVNGVSVATDAEVSSAVAPLATSASVALKANTADLKEIGVGQTWQDVTASRVIESIYTNSTGKPIVVTCNSSNASTGTFGLVAYVGSQQLTTSIANGVNATGYTTSVSFIVPAGGTYKISKVGATAQTNLWLELR